MDFILPDNDTMELMRKEFESLRLDGSTHAFALEQNSASESADTPAPSGATAPFSPYIFGLFLLLYFVKHLGYNTKYGTQIFDTDGSLEQLQCVASNFGRLNGLG